MSQDDLDYVGYLDADPEQEVVYVAPEEAAVEETITKSKKPMVAATAVEPEVVYVAPEPLVSGAEVLLSSLKFESYSHNSLSVALVQERLIELGFDDAGSDNRGWLSVGTKKALALYAGLSEDAVAVDDAELIKKLFAGTAVTILV